MTTGQGTGAETAGAETGLSAGGRREAGFTSALASTASRAVTALEQLAGGLGTAALALFVLLLLSLGVVTIPLGIGLYLTPVALRAMHGVARRERDRLGRWGPEVVGPGPLSTRLGTAWADPDTHRVLRWLVRHATSGLALGMLGVMLPLFALRDTTFPLWWSFVPEGVSSTSVGVGIAHSWVDATAAGLLGIGWTAIILGLAPGMARLQARPGRRLLAAGPEADLSLRVAELTATRAEALDAHASELRRIERALHDGAQNRLITVTVLLGAARRMVARAPADADELLERAQSAAEQALAELRTVSRSILPPVLADRGLEGALTGLATSCAVPCGIEVEAPGRCAASVEATAYFVVAEALSNVTKHSGARRAAVTVGGGDGHLRLRVEDDGRGGAEEGGGSGLAGIRRRVAAHDGSLTLTSPPGGPTVLEVLLPSGV
ncbi:sensor histidine kinase [Streptomyces albus]|uniref:sensor histidine kinase n=1 Tax=Streptomyces albus TaxID=1888 RepID=UPI0006E1B7D8|nr:sensor domain-containing protein [Streptomyces albus]